MSINKDISPENYLTDYLELAGKNKKKWSKAYLQYIRDPQGFVDPQCLVNKF